MADNEIVTPDANGEGADPQHEAPIATPQNELYAALSEERARRKELERKLKEAEAKVAEAAPPIAPVQHSDEGLAIKTELTGEIKRLEETIRTLSEDVRLKEVLSKHPVLRENLVEFDEYRKDYPGLPIDKVAMVFLSEKGVLNKVVRRPGLEQPSGGDRQAPPADSYSADELKRLRTDEPRKYVKMLREGKIKLSDLKD
jgi:hypothetical protein